MSSGLIFMAEILTDEAIEAALAAGQKRLQKIPHGVMVKYSPKNGLTIVELSNGCWFGFPAHKVEGLENATAHQLAGVTLQSAGYALEWASLDVQADISALTAGIFGTRATMAKMAGSTTSDRKAAAARDNGAKGGRPPGSPNRDPKTGEKIAVSSGRRRKNLQKDDA